ncbi:MAG: helix-turn-helix domain-containing protein [Streptosporangiales bacterium]|nr:helix-turn-helix domain-containing protein [Streptosporangiales bacterium]
MTQERAAADGGGSVQVLQKSARILDCFSATRPRLRAADIVQFTGMPTSTVARILRTLVGENLLQRHGAEYSIGLRVTVWSAAAGAGSDLIATAAPLVARLRDRSGESGGLYIRQGEARVSVVQAESNKSIIFRGYVGQMMPLHAGAAGKVFLAYDPAALDAAIATGLPPSTPKTVVDKTVLEEQLAEVRRRGWAFAEEEREEGLNSLSAPVFGADGGLVAAVAIGGPSFRLTKEAAERLSGVVTECATEISRGLLYGGPPPP